MWLLSFVQLCNCYRYGCMYVLSAFFSVVCRCYGNGVSCSNDGGCGMSDVYMLKSVGGMTLPCGMPVLNWHCLDVYSLTVMYASFDVVSYEFDHGVWDVCVEASYKYVYVYCIKSVSQSYSNGTCNECYLNESSGYFVIDVVQ